MESEKAPGRSPSWPPQTEEESGPQSGLSRHLVLGPSRGTGWALPAAQTQCLGLRGFWGRPGRVIIPPSESLLTPWVTRHLHRTQLKEHSRHKSQEGLVQEELNGGETSVYPNRPIHLCPQIWISEGRKGQRVCCHKLPFSSPNFPHWA